MNTTIAQALLDVDIAILGVLEGLILHQNLQWFAILGLLGFCIFLFFRQRKLIKNK